MAYLKFSCKEGQPAFFHDGGSGYVESGNRLLGLARDERSLPPDEERVDFLSPHRRMFEVRLVPAMYPQNWTAQVDSAGLSEQEMGHLASLKDKIDETIAGRDEFQLADFLLYYSVAYDFQVVWTGREVSILPPPIETGPQAVGRLRLVYSTNSIPMFMYSAQAAQSLGPVLRFYSRQALSRGKGDSVEIGLHLTYESSGKPRFTAGIKVNNYGSIPAIALNQAYWNGLVQEINEALPARRELDLSGAVAFLSPAYDVSVFTPKEEPAKAARQPSAQVAPPQQARVAPRAPKGISAWLRRFSAGLSPFFNLILFSILVLLLILFATILNL